MKQWQIDIPTSPASSAGEQNGDVLLGPCEHSIQLCLIPELEEEKPYQKACAILSSLDLHECLDFGGN